MPAEDKPYVWKCAGRRFDNWEDWLRFYYIEMPGFAEAIIELKRKRKAQSS